jgi:hypothetical protein
MVKRINHAVLEKQEFSRTENGDVEDKKKKKNLKKEVMLLINLPRRLKSVKLIRLKKRLNKRN